MKVEDDCDPKYALNAYFLSKDNEEYIPKK